jgi:glycosyltransferase involved in cell wall biosynthesis
MKVAIYANISGYASGAGGVQTYLAALIKSLGELDDGPEKYFLLGPSQGAEWLEEVSGSNQKVMKMANFGLDWGRRTVHRVGRVVTYLSSLSPFGKHGHVHTKWSAQTGLGVMVPISNGFIESLGVAVIHFPYQTFVVTSVPSIYNPHDLQHLHLPQNFAPDQLMWREVCYPFACRIASKVVATSRWVAADLQNQYGIPNSKLAVIPWGGTTSHFPKPSDADVRKIQAKYKLEQNYILYPAIPWGHKNHRGLVEALKILKSRNQAIMLALCGAGTERSDLLETLISRACVGDIVRPLGYIPGPELRALYRGATALVVPSLFEAAGGLIAEAWLEGTPVACSDIPGHKEAAEGCAEFFDPFMPENIATTIHKVTSDVALRQRLIAAGHAKVASLNWRQTAEQYRSLYRQVAKETGMFAFEH